LKLFQKNIFNNPKGYLAKHIQLWFWEEINQWGKNGMGCFCLFSPVLKLANTSFQSSNKELLPTLLPKGEINNFAGQGKTAGNTHQIQ
jgi:hypothetical protein